MTDKQQTTPAIKTPAGRIPGEEGVWVFIGGDLIVFAVFFITYAVAHRQESALFETSQRLLDRHLGLLNTLLLLTSSLCVAQAVTAVRKGDRRARHFLLGAIALGMGFVAVKAVEYSAKIAEGFTLNTNAFSIYYYMFTGIHLVHVVIGIGVLCFAASQIESSGQMRGSVALIEGSGVFWHMVDLLWIILFALLYLL
ncbi:MULTISPECIES: cytochrome c oxidase subunit 3 [unclassified Novosphingobium]|uniref:cytochrome c oxidase subunit 3 n=1 Tax=unclassified Novosphingobium TaxID=2644732 RepID=UPI0037564161